MKMIELRIGKMKEKKNRQERMNKRVKQMLRKKGNKEKVIKKTK